MGCRVRVIDRGLALNWKDGEGAQSKGRMKSDGMQGKGNEEVC